METWWGGVQPATLALLLLGHVLADFALQPTRLVAAKRTSDRALAIHAGIVAWVQGALILPFDGSAGALGSVLVIAISHAIIDRAKIELEKVLPSERLFAFLADQALHLAVLYGLAMTWDDVDAPNWVTRLAFVISILVFNVNGGSALVSAALGPMQARAHVPEGAEPGKAKPGDQGPPGAGRRIGVLERWMVLGLVALGEWAAVGLVLTAKSIARFKRLEEQPFAEVYLVGTMTSVLVAMASGLLLRFVLLP